MKLKTIGEIVDFLKAWAVDHSVDIIELLLVGSQADVLEYDSSQNRSDIDIVVMIRNDANPTELLSELAAAGLRLSILFHPLFMTEKERDEKLRIQQYRRMLDSGRRIYPKDKSTTTG